MSVRVLGSSIRAAVGKIYARHPVLSNMVLYGTLYASGDVSQQTLLRKPSYDWENTARISAVGGTIFGPSYYVWYSWLDRRFPGSIRSIVLRKVVVDQAIAGTLGILVFFAATTALQPDGKVWEEVKTKWPKTYLTGCFYWPLVQFVNFTFLPPHLRTTCVGVAAFVWTNFLCYLKSVHLPETPEQDKPEAPRDT